MLKRIGLIGLTSAALTFVFAACGEGIGPGGAGCTSNADCATTEICHPQAQVCVQTCTSSADCPDSAKTCEAISATDTNMICKCTTDALCASGDVLGSSAICSDAFEVCVTKCGSNTDCPSGFECETSTGECKSAACTTNTDCASGQTCNTTTGQCEAAAACDSNATTIGSNGGPSTCSYGQECQSGSCVTVEQGTCSQASTAPAWTAATTGRPVITNVTAVGSATSNSTTECGDGGPKTEFTVSFYSATPLFNTGTFATWKQSGERERLRRLDS